MLVFILNRAVSDPVSPVFEPKQANVPPHRADVPATVAVGAQPDEGAPVGRQDGSMIPRVGSDSPPPKPKRTRRGRYQKPRPGRYVPRPPRTARALLMAFLAG